MGLNHFAPYLATAAPGVAAPVLGGAAASFAAGRLASSVLRSPTLANRLIDRSLGTARPGVVNRLLGDAASAAPETAAPIYNRGRIVEPTANDNAPASMLDEFLRTRAPQRAGMLP